MTCSPEMLEKAREYARKTWAWLQTEEGQKSLQEAVARSEATIRELALARRVSPEQLNRPFTI